MQKRHLPLFVLGLLFACVTGCPAEETASTPEDAKQTVIIGRAPMNTNGQILAVCHDKSKLQAGSFYIEDSALCDHCVGFRGPIDQSGRFEIPLGNVRGRVTLQAIGGDFTEPASGTLVHHQGEKLHAAIPDVSNMRTREVAVTPWTEIAYARGGVNGYDESLKILTDTLTCNGTAYADVLRVSPAAPEDGIHSLATSRELAYVYMGAFSKLADDLSVLNGIQAGGARLNSMKLAKVLAADFANGRIDGKGRGGETVYLFENAALPPDVLRQQLAQSARRFLQLQKPENDRTSWGNESTLGETAMLDFLRCICDSTDVALGPQDAPLDLNGPALKIASPQHDSYVASSQDVICEAHDPSGVASLRTVFIDADGHFLHDAHSSTPDDVQSATQRAFVQPLRIEGLPTGDVQVRCEATDRWGNASSATITLHINRGKVAPTLSVNADADALLRGRAEITCDCTQDPYSGRCELQSTHAATTLLEQSDRKSRYIWDTREVLDGDYVLECVNATPGLQRPLVTPKQVRVKNHADGTALGGVYLDTPVRGMQVVAYAYTDGTQGRRLGGTDVDDNGQFEFPIVTDYRGPVLIRADYSRSPSKLATFHNVPLDIEHMSCTNAALTLLIEHYEPGADLTGLSLNVGSTMHEALAIALWKRGDEPTFREAAQTAQTVVGNYFSVGTGRALDPRYTWVANFTDKNRATDQEQEVLGLFHVGLSRLAADLSLKHWGIPDRITIAEVIGAMRRDLADGYLDGKFDGVPVFLDHKTPMSEDFFRIDLSRAIRCWVDKAPFTGGNVVPVNNSGLTKEAVTSRAPVVQGFAKHHSSLFNNRPGQNFDGNGPHIDYRISGSDQKEVNLAKPVGNTVLRLAVHATHHAGVVAMEVKLNGEPQTAYVTRSVGSADFLIATEALDGPQTISIRAHDAQDNPPSDEAIHFTVDRLPPTIKLSHKEVWTNDGKTYRVMGEVAKARTTIQAFVDGQPVGQPQDLKGHGFALPIPFTCGRDYRVEVQAFDRAGNIDRQAQTVHCDDVAPTFTLIDTVFHQERDNSALSMRFQEPGETPNTLQKYWHQLDHIPGDARSENNNLPTLRFKVGDLDKSSIGTLPDDLRVSYQHQLNYAVGSKLTGDWQQLTCAKDGVCTLPFSYQTMLSMHFKDDALSTQRGENYIARSSKGDRHDIVIRVIDKAGNESQALWSFFLDLMGPDITVNCEVPDSVRNYRLMPSSLHKFGGYNSVMMRVRVEMDAIAGDSLTPLDGGYDFEFSDLPYTWQVDETLMQVANLGTGYSHDSTKGAGFFETCHADKIHWWRMWEDGECNQRDFKTNNKEWVTGAHPRSTFRQQARPRLRSATLSQQDGQTSLTNQMLSTSLNRSSDGRDVKLESGTTLRGEAWTQYLYREGWEWKGPHGGGPVALGERSMIRNVTIKRPPYLPAYKGTRGGVPAPGRITYNNVCTGEGAMHWQMDRAPEGRY